MTSLPTLLAGFTVLGLAGSVAAQGGTISADNVDYTINTIPDSTTSTNGSAAFTAWRARYASVLPHHWWYYRVVGDGFETPFNTGDTNNDGNNTQGFSEVYNGNQAILVWQDVDERGLMTAVNKITVYSTGARNGMAVQQMTVTNRSGAPVTLNVYTYADWDVCSNANMATGDANGNRHRITNASCNVVCRYLGVGMDRYEAAAWDGLHLRLVDGQVDDLANTGIPWSAGDYTAAFQWANRQLLPGRSATFTALLTFFHDPCASAATSSVYGTGSNGTNGVPMLASLNEPIIGILDSPGLDVTPKMRVSNGVPNGAGTLIGGFGRTNTPVGNVTLYTNPVAQLPFALSANGLFDVNLPIPNVSALCGGQVHFQALLLDPGVSGAFPVAHTAGLEWTLGGFAIE